VTCTPIARQRLRKHIPVRANAGKNRTSIPRQRISKHASLTIEAVFSGGPCKMVIRKCSAIENCSRVGSEGLNIETPACRDMRLELIGIETSELAVAE
jgi:hypothetical protein